MRGFHSHRAHLPRLLRRAGPILLGLFAIWCAILAANWPFTRQAVTYSLERVSGSEVHIGRFRELFFPHPGYVAEDLVFTRGSSHGAAPLVTVRGLTCHATWIALLSITHRVRQIRLDTLHVYIPVRVPPPVRKHPPPKIETPVTELVADGAVLEIAPRHPGGQTLRFDFSLLTVNDVARGKSMNFRAVLHNPEPPGDITARGAFGPVPAGHVGQTPVSGSFVFNHADLSPFHLIAGTLSANGTFKGTLSHMEVDGKTDIPNFEVRSSGHAVHLAVDYQAIVDGLHGDVALQSADARLLDTVLASRGDLSGGPGQGKTVSMDFNSSEARIQDLMRLFVKAPQPPLDGPVVFRAHVVLPPEDESFLRRVQLEGDFGITDGQFTSPHTQGKVEELSERARSKKAKDKQNEDPERTVSDLKGHVILRNGTATFSNASFSVPGALARMQGTYNLITQRVNLQGTLAMQASLSQAAGGIKSILLKPLNPFFRKGRAGSVIAVQMTGTYSHPSFHVLLFRKAKHRRA